MNRIVHVLALAGAVEGLWAFQSFGIDYFGIHSAGWLLALWAMLPLPLMLFSARRIVHETYPALILIAGMTFALLAALALHIDAISAFAAGREPLAGAAILVAPFYQYPIMLIAIALGWFAHGSYAGDNEIGQC
jgi:hypothetical protein